MATVHSEAHLNLLTQGTSQPDGTLLPTERQTHLTLEPTFGLSPNAAIGFMFLNAWQPGYSPQSAGGGYCRISTAPESCACRCAWDLWPSYRFKRRATRRIRAVWSCVRFWIVSSRDGKLFSILFLSAPRTVLARGRGWNFAPAMLVRLETLDLLALA